MADDAFDELIHAPQRLRICAMLSAAEAIEFAEIQARTALSKSALSKQLSALADAGYLAQSTFVRAGRSRLLISLTAAGRRAYAGHKRALAHMLAEEPRPVDSSRR